MATALRKLPELTPFEAARDRWQRATAARRQLAEQIAAARMALNLFETPPGDRERRSPIVEAKAKAYLNGRRPDSDRLREEIRQLQTRIVDGADQHQAEAETWRQAVEAETHRLVMRLKPRHDAAVTAIARAVEALSAAVEAERLVRAELSDVGALHALTDAGFEFGSLGEYESLLSRWNWRLLASGAL